MLKGIPVITLIIMALACMADEATQSSRHAHGTEDYSAVPDDPSVIYQIMLKDPSTREQIEKEEARFTRPPLTLYGRVIDQDGRPVKGAVLDIVYNVNLLVVKTVKAVTDKKGNWQCKIPRNIAMGTPTIGAIRRYGIEWIPAQDPGFQLSRDALNWDAVWRATSSRNRHLNTVTVKGERAYLVEYSYPKIKMGLHEGRPDGYVNMVHRSFGYERNESQPPYDLHFHLRQLDGKQGWELEVQPYGKTAGILLWNGEKPKDAPAEGYQESLKIHLSAVEQSNLLLYARTRDFPVYSEIQLSVYASNPEQRDNQMFGGTDTSTRPDGWVNLFVSRFLLNPFGKRCLQWDDGFDRADRDRIDEIIDGHLKNNQLPDEEAIKKMRVIPDYTKESM